MYIEAVGPYRFDDNAILRALLICASLQGLSLVIRVEAPLGGPVSVWPNVPVNSKTAHPPRANPGAFDFLKKFWSNSPLCCQLDGRMPHPLELQRGSNPPPCHAMHS